MSHFTRIKTKIVEKELLLNSLLDLGCVCEEGRLVVTGYGGRKVPVELRASFGQGGSAVGFSREGEVWECVADWYCVRGMGQEEFLNRLHQRYAYHATVNRLEEQGFSVVAEEAVGTDQSLRLVLRRVV